MGVSAKRHDEDAEARELVGLIREYNKLKIAVDLANIANEPGPIYSTRGRTVNQIIDMALQNRVFLKGMQNKDLDVRSTRDSLGFWRVLCRGGDLDAYANRRLRQKEGQ